MIKRFDDINLVYQEPWERVVFGILMLFVGAWYFLPLYVGWGPNDVMIYFYTLITALFLLMLRLFYRSFTSLRIYREGVLIHSPLVRDRFLPWEDITQIRSAWWTSTLIVSGKRGSGSFRVDFAFTHAQILLMVLANIRRDLLGSTAPITLTMHPVLWIFDAAAIMGLSYSAITGTPASHPVFYWVQRVIICLLALGTALVLSWIPYRVVLTNNGLEFHYLFRTITVRMEEITYVTQSASIQIIFFELGQVFIQLRKGDPVMLMLYTVGPALLYAFLTAWFYRNTEDPDPDRPTNFHRDFLPARLALPE